MQSNAPRPGSPVEHSADLRNAMAANREEAQLEAIVEVVGTAPAQDAAREHQLPVLVATTLLEADS